MKKILFALMISSSILLAGCGAGVEKDLMSGQKISYSGLTYDEIIILYEGKEITKDQEIALGEVIEIYFSGISGFKEDNGKVFPGASMAFASSTGEEEVVADDVFEEQGVGSAEAEDMKLTATIDSPLVSGEKYILKIKIWDKKGEGKIESEINLRTSGDSQDNVNTKSSDNKQADNSLPMYGGIDVVKTPKMLQADESFIAEVTREVGSKEVGAVAAIEVANEHLEEGDLETAMMRFNQAWLLDSSNKKVYIGFVEILKLQGRMDEADKITEEYL